MTAHAVGDTLADGRTVVAVDETIKQYVGDTVRTGVLYKLEKTVQVEGGEPEETRTVTSEMLIWN